MISSKHRFHGPISLRYVYRNGQTTRGPLFSIKSTVNRRRDTYRAAVVVGRKVNKSAVVRNRIRRRLYETIRAVEQDITEPYDVVVTVFHDAVASEPSESLNKLMKKQLSIAGVLVKRIK